ncbi:VWA domain-containing protein [Parahaliea sp. F7430]|uniref:VWA domain-containing protein n=1 Tax=Sediminihaliea albiluteola TaxID=2758564 RepID=A0A7W2TUG4_9GAMM|nr:vWA domain-containing protein [Sediminihaliea albiluteola]MBA6412093.1 VWA domain-containing protein [Sediminihaliea albiluteola]
MSDFTRRAALLRGLLLTAMISLLCSSVALADAVVGRGLQPDLRLLIDISGSMKQSDPDNLRGPALELIVRLLPDGARAGVWVFGEEAEVLVPHGEVDAAWRDQARQAVAQIDNSGQRTNIPAALSAATYDIASMNPAYRSSVILLTDGKVDISSSPIRNAKAARALLMDTAPELGAIGIPVHTIALSDDADWSFLRALAASTTGIAEKAKNAGQLTEIFVQSLDMVAPAARVPLAGAEFVIDDSVEEFTALLFHKDSAAALGLIAPSAQVYQPSAQQAGVDWFLSDRFALVTVTAPEPGVWQLQAPRDARVRVTVIADLQLEVDPLPNSMPAQRMAELGIRLRNAGELITDPELLGLFDITVDISGPKGFNSRLDVSGQYAVPETGEYRVKVPGFVEPGRYQLLARVKGETLQRELPMYVEVIGDPSSIAFNTRPLDIPQTSLRGPILSLAAVVFLIAVISWLISRRRRRQRLRLWQQRFEAAQEGQHSPSVGSLKDLEGERSESP